MGSRRQAEPACVSIPKPKAQGDPEGPPKPPQTGGFCQPDGVPRPGAVGGSCDDRRRAASIAARSRPSSTPSAWARAASRSSGAGRSCRHFSFVAEGPESCTRDAAAAVRRTIEIRVLRRREAADDEAESLDGVPRRDLVHAAQDLRPEVGELVGPDRRRALDGELAAAKRLRPRPAGHGIAHGARPRGVGARLVTAREPVERRRDDVAEPAREVALCCRRRRLAAGLLPPSRASPFFPAAPLTTRPDPAAPAASRRREAAPLHLQPASRRGEARRPSRAPTPHR